MCLCQVTTVNTDAMTRISCDVNHDGYAEGITADQEGLVTIG